MGTKSAKKSRKVTILSSALFNVVARLVAWYGIYTILFRCPSHPTPDSPKICHVHRSATDTLTPHIEPYYNTYVSPFVTQYAPCIKHANEVYVIPAYNSASASYGKYVAPFVHKGKEFAEKEYKPRLDEAAGRIKGCYHQYIEPQLKAGGKRLEVLRPLWEAQIKRVEKFERIAIFPAYEKCLPYILKTYEKARYVFIAIVVPSVREGSGKAMRWGAGVWRDVVRPQVGRIGERLGASGNGIPVASAPSLSSHNAKASASSSTLSSAASSESSKDGPKKFTPEEVRITIESDLETWTNKLETAVEKASADLSARIDEITLSAMDENAMYVKGEVDGLEKLIEDEFAELKAEVLYIIEALKRKDTEEDGGDNEESKKEAYDKLFAATRNTGVKIRDRAQEIRLESQQFLAKTYDDVAAAADNHLEVLDSVRDIGMQELGMKWAWMDHVTHKDWRRYHILKKEFESARRGVVMSAQGNENLVKITRWVENEWEGRATEVAKQAAEELQRLKRVSKRKIELRDDAEGFSSSILPVVMEKAAQKVLKNVEEAKGAVMNAEKEGEMREGEMGTETVNAKDKIEDLAGDLVEEYKENIEELSEKASGAIYRAEGASTNVLPGSQQHLVKSVVSEVSEKVEEAANTVSEKVG